MTPTPAVELTTADAADVLTTAAALGMTLPAPAGTTVILTSWGTYEGAAYTAVNTSLTAAREQLAAWIVDEWTGRHEYLFEQAPWLTKPARFYDGPETPDEAAARIAWLTGKTPDDIIAAAGGYNHQHREITVNGTPLTYRDRM